MTVPGLGVAARKETGADVGEIRSTMDIIMEKTRSLAPSEEEKASFRRREIEVLARGLVQKVQDKILSPEKVRDTLEDQAPDRREPLREALIRSCIERLDPGSDHAALLELLSDAAGVDPAQIESGVAESASRLEARAGARRAALLEGLRGKGISGSAVRANLEADPEWPELVEQERQALRRALERMALDR